MKKIVLEGDWVLKILENRKQEILPIVQNPSDVEIEFRNVEKWDVSGVQLLYALKRHCSLHQKKVSFFISEEGSKGKEREWLDILNTHV